MLWTVEKKTTNDQNLLGGLFDQKQPIKFKQLKRQGSHPAFFSFFHPSPPLSGQSGWRNKLYTLCSACNRHTLKPLCSLNTSNTPPVETEKPSCVSCSQIKFSFVRYKAAVYHVTHKTTGTAVMSSSGKGVKRLHAGHTQDHLIVSDPARGSFAKLLCLWNTFCFKTVSSPRQP